MLNKRNLLITLIVVLMMVLVSCQANTAELDDAKNQAATAEAQAAAAQQAAADAQATAEALAAAAEAGSSANDEELAAAQAAQATAEAEAAAAQQAAADAQAALEESQTAGGETADEKPVTLAVWYLSQSPEELDLIRDQIAIFEEAHPNITIEFSAYGFDDMNNTLRLALDGGVAPDVAYASPGPSYGGAYAEAGHLVDLLPAAEKYGWADHFAESVIAYYNPDYPNSLYQMPFDLVTVGVYYNTEIYANLGLEPPTTLQEFEDQLATIKEAGITPISVGALDGWPLGHIWDQLVHTSVPYDFIEGLEAEDPSSSYDDPRIVQAAETVNSWNEMGYFQDNVLATSYADGNNLFINGDAAINIGGTWNNGTFATQPDFEVGFFALPQVDPSLDWHMGGFSPNNAWMVPVYSEHQDEALAFVDFMLQEGVATAKWNAGDIPAYQFDVVPDPTVPLQADVYNAMQNAATGTYLGNSSPEVAQAIWDNLQAMLAGDLTPEEAMGAIQEVYVSVQSE
ncbi:MAG: extracellular solute-binding protein [Candidatus Promineifilaceae bacterium]